MQALKILPDIYWVGVVDWNIRTFHGHTYSTKRGTTYNAYLILDDKITLVDAVYGPFAAEMIERIKEIIPEQKIDYLIVNHLEPDHTGALPEIIKLYPQVKLFCTQKCKEGLSRYYNADWDIQVVHSGEKLKLGKHTLTFIEAPMIHWPDSMFTYCEDEALLLPNDAFGQHYATSERFDDQIDLSILMEETAKYYANILWPLSQIILKKIEEIQKLNIPIKMIAPSHGIIWRKDPQKAIKAYLSWGKNETKAKVVVVYESMWGATEMMARKIVEGITDAGISVKLFDAAVTERTEIIAEMLEAGGFIIGSSSHDNDTLPTIAGFLHFFKGLKPKNRIGCVFGSYGWAGGAIKSIEEIFKQTGIEIAQPALGVQYGLNENELRRCYEYGMEFAQKLKKE